MHLLCNVNCLLRGQVGWIHVHLWQPVYCTAGVYALSASLWRPYLLKLQILVYCLTVPRLGTFHLPQNWQCKYASPLYTWLQKHFIEHITDWNRALAIHILEQVLTEMTLLYNSFTTQLCCCKTEIIFSIDTKIVILRHLTVISKGCPIFPFVCP